VKGLDWGLPLCGSGYSVISRRINRAVGVNYQGLSTLTHIFHTTWVDI